MTAIPKTRPRLAIVGGGYLGSDLAKALEEEMDVTLIERASHFTHAPAMIDHVSSVEERRLRWEFPQRYGSFGGWFTRLRELLQSLRIHRRRCGELRMRSNHLC